MFYSSSEYPSHNFNYNPYRSNGKFIRTVEKASPPPTYYTNTPISANSNIHNITLKNSFRKPPDNVSFLRQFCQDTTVHGLGFAGNSRITKFERILWGLIFLVTSAFLIFTMTSFYSSDQSVLTTVIQNASYSIADIPFPSVTLCNSANFNWTRYKEAETLFLPQNATAKTRLLFKKFLILYNDLPFANIKIRDRPPKPFNLTSEELKELDFLIIKDVFDFMAWKCEENFKSCTWLGINMSCCELFKRKYTELGLCFSFNSITNIENLIKAAVEKKQLLYSTVKGESGALQIQVKDDTLIQDIGNERPKRSIKDTTPSNIKQNELKNLNLQCNCTNISYNGSTQNGIGSNQTINPNKPPAAPNGIPNIGKPPAASNGTPNIDKPPAAPNGISNIGKPPPTNGLGNFNNPPKDSNNLDPNKPSTSSHPEIKPHFNGPPDLPKPHIWRSEFNVDGEHGFSMSIHNALESPVNDIFLTLGGTAKFSIEPTYHFSKEEIKIVPSSVRQCLFEFEVKDILHSTLPNHIYNLINCLQECKRQYIYKICKCVPDIIYPIGNYPACKASDYPCLSKISSILRNIVKLAGHLNSTNLIVCYCMSACNKVQLGLTKYIDKGPPPEFRKPGFNHLSLTVFYEVETFIRYETSLSKNWLDYLVYYGGIASFFLGCSLLSFVEVIYYFTIRLIIYFSCKKYNK